MSGTSSFSLPLDDGASSQGESKAKLGPSGGGEEIKWTVVAKMPGLTPAQIVAGRLQAEGIPARAWQEGAGQAYGLTVGLLGTGYVVVPEESADKASAILAADAEDNWDDAAWSDDAAFDDEE